MLPQFLTQHLSNTLLACAKLGQKPSSSWQQHFWAACEGMLPQFIFKAQNFANTLYAACVLATLDHPTAASIWDAAVKLFSDPGVPLLEEELRQLFLVFKAAEVELPGSRFTFPSAPLLQRARDAWLNSNTSTSDLETQVSDCLHRLGVPHRRNVLCTKSDRTIDFVIESGSYRFALEVDGPTHFLKVPERTPDGFTRFRDRMLRAHGWRVLSVPFYEWNFIPEAQQDAYLRKLLDDALVSKNA